MKGLTLVELLVVIAVIALLVALLLPAVQMARESARRVQCANGFKQVALATLNHASTTDSLPPLLDSRFPYGFNSVVGWRFTILPFLEESAIHDRLSDAATWHFQVGPAADEPPQHPGVVEALLCPSTPGTPLLDVNIRAVKRDGGGVLFDAFAHRQTGAVAWVFDRQTELHGAWTGTTLPYEDATNPKIGNARYKRNPAKLRWITDGLSQTILVMERAGAPEAVFGLKSKKITGPHSSWIRASGTGYLDNLFLRGKVPAILQDLATQFEGPVNFSNYFQIYSFHPSGAHVSLCDGSVKFLSEATSHDAALALGTRASVDVFD